MKELDAVVDDCFAKMQAEADRRASVTIDEWTRKAIADGKSQEEASKMIEEMRAEIERGIRWKPDDRAVTAYLSGGRSVSGKNFGELATLSKLREEMARAFLISARAGETKLQVSLDSSYPQGLTIDVSCDDDDLAQALFGKLQNWALDIAPPKWQRIWLAWGALAALMAGMFAATIFGVIFAASISRTPSGDLKQEARTLLKQGVNSSNQIHALELLLAIESGYDSNQYTPGHVPSARYWATLCLITFLIVGLATCPKNALGLWKGRDKVKRGRTWIKILSVSTPLLIVTRVIFPWFVRLLAGQ